MAIQGSQTEDEFFSPENGPDHFEGEGVLSDRLLRLAHDIVQVGAEIATHSPTGLDCDECEELLEIYVSDYIQGASVTQQYPAIWHHLQTCADCHDTFQWLLEDAQLRKRSSKAIQLPWKVQERQWTEGGKLRVSYQWSNLALYETLVTNAQGQAMRMLTAGEKHLLLNDEFPSPRDHLIQIDVTARRPLDGGGDIMVQATIVSQAPLPDVLRATLQWGPITKTTEINSAGIALFDPVPLTALQLEDDSNTFVITFEG